MQMGVAFEETGGMLSAFATSQNFREDVVKSYLEQNDLDYSKIGIRIEAVALQFLPILNDKGWESPPLLLF